LKKTAETKSTAVAFRTLGCKQNQFDARWLQSQLPGQNFSITVDLQKADWIVLTCCAVTERAIAKARGELHRVKREYPAAKVIVLGCGPRYQPDQFEGADFIDHIPSEFGISGYKHAIGSNLVGQHGLVPDGRSRAYLRIQNGCDQFCTFCIVPHLRGRSRSVPLNELQQSLLELAETGIAEIVLTGTNIALWGRDLDQPSTLLDLLKSLSGNLKNARLRLSSLEPQYTPPDLFEWCVRQKGFCDHFHIAVQSGSGKILKKMGRGVLAHDLFTELHGIKQKYPDVSLGADVLVGFPSETELDFQHTKRLIEEIPFNYLHVFPYSERQGTPSVSFPDTVERSTRLERAARLRKLDHELRAKFIEQNIGKTADVILLSKGPDPSVRGLTSNYLPVALSYREGIKHRRFKTILSKTSLHYQSKGK